MDCIDPLLIMEDDLDNAYGDDNDDDATEVPGPAVEDRVANEPPLPTPQERRRPLPEWCVCCNCSNMPLDV